MTGIDRMRGFRAIALFLVLGFLGSGCFFSNDFLGLKYELTQHSLDNGINVLLVEDHSLPVVSFQTWVKVGSVDEAPGKTGLAHLFEHLMFKGTKEYPKRAFFKELETKGAEVNAFTTRDYTVFFENFVPTLLDKVIEMESDRFINLSLTEEDLQNELGVVLEERRLRIENSPGGKMQEALWALAYDFHPYRYPVAGDPRDLLSISLEDLTEFFKSYYVSENITLVLVGDFDSEATLKKIEKTFGKIKSKKRPVRTIVEEPAQESEKRINLYDHVKGERLAMGFHVPSAHDMEAYTIDVLVNILFNGTSSRVNRRVVEEKELAHYVSGSAYTPTYPGLLVISAVTKGEATAVQIENEIISLMEEVKKKGVTKEEVDAAVRQLTVQIVDSVTTPFGLGKLLGTVRMVLGDADAYEEDVKKYFRVDQRMVKAAAIKYLHQNNKTTVVMLPEAKRPKEKK